MAEEIVFGGGCFWCIEAVFQRIPGIVHVESGYAGGQKSNPTYREVCSGTTGHAEVVRVTYEADQIKLSDVLDKFFMAHDPTTLNRQGADTGTQYRSIILFADASQKAEAEAAIGRAQARFKDPIVTEVVPLTDYFAAEKYHQNYYNDNGEAGYCQYVIAPKLKKLGL
jgi:peptide-methionine (S)-S-oxide reductase